MYLVLLIAIILFITIILVIFLISGLFYPEQNPLLPISPPKKKCKIDVDCKDNGHHCVGGFCTKMNCLEAAKYDIKGIKLDPNIRSCNYTPKFYKFSSTADPQSPFGKSRIEYGELYDPHSGEEFCESLCANYPGCISWEYDQISGKTTGNCYFYRNPHPALKYKSDAVMAIPRKVL
uniref:Envelope protein 167 n=1 Tax=African swine fever virus (isolate Warthog/Namibia/Wart80/1980) TaxID=561444 RepID=EV167_ASFWA|nr:RecName: Full=Envelope protein 167 [African swine fever virus warthog/Namibia/Wart80/1980]